jgi:hypothetical protein
MNTKHIFTIFQVLCLVSMIGGFVLAAPSSGPEGSQDPLLVAQIEEKKVITDSLGNLTLIDEDTQDKADALAGTCPKGFHCSCPDCPLWSDLDEDNFCDHGEEPDDMTEE